jgi:hypothetical protein
MSRTHLVLFYTQGAPFDNGTDLTEAYARMFAAASPSFDVVHSYSLTDARRVAKNTPGYESILDPEQDPALSHYWHAPVGYYAFKPLLIMDVLEKAAAGDLVFYHDVNLIKYVEYQDTEWPCVPSMMRKALASNHADIFVPFEKPGVLPVFKFVKAYTLRNIMKRSVPHNDPLFSAPLMRANRFAAIKSPAAMAFVGEWLELCSHKDLISPLPSPDPHPHFIGSCGDQDILNAMILAKKECGILPKSFPIFWFRKNTMSNHNMMEWVQPKPKKYSTAYRIL